MKERTTWDGEATCQGIPLKVKLETLGRRDKTIGEEMETNRDGWGRGKEKACSLITPFFHYDKVKGHAAAFPLPF